MNVNKANGPGRRLATRTQRIIFRPDLVIPCGVARQQSPTPFHQAITILSHLRLSRIKRNKPCKINLDSNTAS
jgi:hypothetical protein